MPERTRNLCRHFLPCLAAALVLATGCATVSERLAEEADAETPKTDAAYLNASGGDDAFLPGELWKLFQDPVLDRLIARLNDANPDVSAALARVDQSFALLGITRASQFPTIRGNAALGRRRDSVNNLLFPIATPEYNRFQLGAGANWEIDLWGRVRSSVKRDRLRAEAGALDYRQVLLSLQSSLAQQYFAWRAAATELALLRESHAHDLKKLELEEARLRFGQGVAADVARARLAVSRGATALEASERGAGRLRHAVAVLTGVLPSELEDLTGETAAPLLPVIPAGMPSDLLARRPDLIAADRRLRAAAVQVGVRRVDYLPRLTLSGSGGIASLRASNLFEANSSLFDIGPQLDIPIFQGRVARSAVAQARAEFREAGALYRSAFLAAVREVDDALLDARSYEREIAGHRSAVEAAAEAAEAARESHETGLGSLAAYLAAEQTRLEAAVRESAVAAEQRLAAVRLIQSLGGGWDDAGEQP